MNSNESAISVYQGFSESQLQAIDNYTQQLLAIDNPVLLQQKCLDMYCQTLRMHNTYTKMLDYKKSMVNAYQEQKQA